MNWLFDNFQIVAIIGLAFASWLKHRYDSKMAEREEREARNAPQDPEEYFGPPENWEPPPQIPQPYIPPPISRTPPPLPRGQTPLPPQRHSREAEAATVLQRQQDMQERFRKVKEARANTTGGAAATRARLTSSQTGGVTVVSSTPTTPSIRKALENPAELRRAIVMKEILGPPVSLR